MGHQFLKKLQTDQSNDRLKKQIYRGRWSHIDYHNFSKVARNVNTLIGAATLRRSCQTNENTCDP